MNEPRRMRSRDRAAGAFLIAVMVLGSPILWVGVPAGSSWLAAQLTADATAHLQITVPVTIAGMILFARLLFWINQLYMRVSDRASAGDLGNDLDDEEEDGESPRRFARGPLESILVCSLVIALGALTVWFFVLAENPSRLVF